MNAPLAHKKSAGNCEHNRSADSDAPIATGDAVRVDGYIPPAVAEVVAIRFDRAWVTWSNGVDAIVPVASLSRAGEWSALS